MQPMKGKIGRRGFLASILGGVGVFLFGRQQNNQGDVEMPIGGEPETIGGKPLILEAGESQIVHENQTLEVPEVVLYQSASLTFERGAVLEITGN